MLVLSAALAVVDYRLERDRIYRNAVLRSQTLAAEVDRELAGIESALRLLATASELASGDLASFHRRAVDALKAQVRGHYVMTDRQGRQIINTLLPFGAPLPAPAGPVLMAPVFETGQPFLSPLFTGGVNQNAVVALGVPVFRGTEVVYSLSMGLPPERFGEHGRAGAE